VFSQESQRWDRSRRLASEAFRHIMTQPVPQAPTPGTLWSKAERKNHGPYDTKGGLYLGPPLRCDRLSELVHLDLSNTGVGLPELVSVCHMAKSTLRTLKLDGYCPVTDDLARALAGTRTHLF
jgi:hypothetical protein